MLETDEMGKETVTKRVRNGLAVVVLVDDTQDPSANGNGNKTVTNGQELLSPCSSICVCTKKK